MMTETSCEAAAGRASRAPVRVWLGCFLLAALLVGCAAPEGAGTGRMARPEGPAARPPTDALAFDDAVVRMTDALLARAEVDPPRPGARLPLLVDPLIDRATGDESAATRRMENRIAAVVRDRHPDYELRPFNTANLEARPLVLLGSITPVAGPGVVPGLTGGQPGAYRIWAVLADLRTGKVVAHETAWIRAGEVDPTPTAFYRDSPVWLADGSVAAYLRTCAANPGDPVDPEYLRSLQAAAAAADGVRAYEAGRYQEALLSLAAATQRPAGDQLRVRNGIYLSNLALGRRQEAEEAFGQLVDYGLTRGKLSVKLVFQPGSTAYWRDREVTGLYPMWIRQIAGQGAASGACLVTVGHTSPTGAPAVNDRLSLARAEAVRRQLVQRAPALSRRAAAEGRGSREPVVGTGRDDASDVLDRRVEFLSGPCTAPPSRT